MSEPKSAYELALERMERDGIDRPRSESLSDATRAEIAEVRSKAEARLAELEILHRDRLAESADPTERDKAEQNYRAERDRIEVQRDRRVAQLRGDG